MKRIIITVLLWTLVIGWMGGIFYMSHQSRVDSGNASKEVAVAVYENIDLTPERFENKSDEWLLAHYTIFVRKAAHLFQYIILGILLALAIGRHSKTSLWVFLISLSVGVLYSVSDELHQHFIPGRTGMLSDVLLDSVGVLIGCTVVLVITLAIIKIKKRNRAK